MIDRHFHWEFVAYNGEPIGKEIAWPVTVEVVGHITEDDASNEARMIVVRDNFMLRRVWVCQSCGFQQQYTDSMKKLAQTTTEKPARRVKRA